MKTKQDLFDIFDTTLSNTGETHPARLWEIICWENDIDEEDEEIGEIYDEWCENSLVEQN